MTRTRRTPSQVDICEPVARPCEQCGVEFLPKTARGRFCSPYCRRRAWLARNPEKAAELAERDRARLRAHVIALGGVWVEHANQQ